MNRLKLLPLFILLSIQLILSNTYVGVVKDQQDVPISYASIYLKEHPEIGTITDSLGRFNISVQNAGKGTLMCSFLGYKMQQLPLAKFQPTDTLFIILEEQPIPLENVVVEAPVKKKSNRKKLMQQLLQDVYERMLIDFPDDPIDYSVVSDVTAYADDKVLLFEEMIGHVLELGPDTTKKGKELVQFKGDLCKRYFSETIMQMPDSIMAMSDSTARVHRMLWGGDLKSAFRGSKDEVKRWKVSKENQNQFVLTYSEKKNYLGIFSYDIAIHYIINSRTYSIMKVSENVQLKVNIPFGYKLNTEEVEMFNTLLLGRDNLKKLRIKGGDMNLQRNVIYKLTPDRSIVQEKNMVVNATIKGSQKTNVKIRSTATVQVNKHTTKGVKPYSKKQLKTPPPVHILPVP